MNERRRLLINLLKLVDLSIVVFAFAVTTILAVELDRGISLVRFLSMRTRISNFGLFMMTLFVCHLVFQICGLYESRRLSRRRTEVLDLAKATTLNIACFMAIGSLFSIQMITVKFLLMFWLVSTVVLSLSRLTLRLVAARVRLGGRDLRYMLILGTNSRAVEFARRLTENPQRGFRVVGFVDDEWPGLNEIDRSRLPVVSDYAGLAEYLRRNVVDEVAVYLPFGSFYRYSSEVASLCQQHGITMRFNSDIFGLKTSRWRADEFYGDHHISTFTGSSGLWPQTGKRFIDITIAASAVLLLSPVLVMACMAIWLTSPGPILFAQERIGLNKRRFKIYKFRTMVPDAEKMMAALEHSNEVAGPVFKIKNDPRITPVGRLLRRSSIDELPQLVNVLRGDMSLVGPRPLPVRDYEGFNEDWQRRRFSVKPGITCLWQVNGRSGISFEQWMQLDLQYMDEWSLWLDVKILAKTVPAVLKGSGAA